MAGSPKTPVQLAMEADNGPIEEAARIDPRLYNAKLARFKADSRGTPKKLRESQVDIKLIGKANKQTGVVKYTAPRDSKSHATNVKHLKLSPNDISFPDRSIEQAKMKLFKCAPNDAFETPGWLFKWMSAMVGANVSNFTDPCPLGHNTVDGLKVERWLAADGTPAIRVYVNPPFSTAFDWIEKLCQQIEQFGIDAILLIPVNVYFGPHGIERSAKWLSYYSRCHFSLLSQNDYVSGAAHGWCKWGENLIEGGFTGGPPSGVVMARVSKGSGDSVQRANEAGKSVIREYKARRKVKAAPLTDAAKIKQLTAVIKQQDDQLKIVTCELAAATAVAEQLKLAEEIIEIHENSGEDIIAPDADDDSVSSVASSGKNWQEAFPDIVATPWDSDEDTEQFKQFSGRDASHRWTASDFVNPPFSEPEPELEDGPPLEPELEPEPPLELEDGPAPEPEPEPEAEPPLIVQAYDAGSPDFY